MPVDKKFTKNVVSYQERATSSDRCGDCDHFKEPNGCEIVHGTISPGGWCVRFERSDDDEGDHEYR